MSALRITASLAALTTLLTACPEADLAPAPAPAVPGEAATLEGYLSGPMAMRRLTSTQYVATVRALFGEDLEVFPPTEVDIRVEGLLSLGANVASVTPAGMERYEASARQIGTWALAPERRAHLLDCAPADEDGPDDACATAFVETIGPRVLRRALRPDEVDTYVALAAGNAATLGSFYDGLASVLSGWLLSADFLFIQERAQAASPTDTSPGLRLTGETLASRLSYFLWHSGPDPALLEAARAGDLETNEGYEAQVDRLVADTPRLETGVRAFFTDLYGLDDLDGVEKDAAAFPSLTLAAVADAKEQTLRTIADHLLTRRADYRDLFTTRHTFMTRNLGPIYEAPVTEDWEGYTFAADSPRAGILSHVSFLALQARASHSSPVLRGAFILDALLCKPIPPPPADVNFEALAPEVGVISTARERLAVHRDDPACSYCHDLMDPIGLALENFDAIGRFRAEENGLLIETHGDIFGEPFDDVSGFFPTLRETPELTACLVRQLYMHAVGRTPSAGEDLLLDALEADFRFGGYDVVELMRTIALTHGFRSTSGAQEAPP